MGGVDANYFEPLISFFNKLMIAYEAAGEDYAK